jgi:hypothetical protein
MFALSCPGCGAHAPASATHCAYCTRTLTSVGCPRCYARLVPGMRFCAACGVRGVDRDEAHTVLACPACATRGCTSVLHHVTLGETAFHECKGCGGVWLARERVSRLERDTQARAELAPVARRPTPAVPPRAAGPLRYRRCPGCAALMHRVNIARISGVIVDRCAAHGDFFDADELAGLVRFWEEGGADRARALEREALAAERRKLALLQAIDAKRDRWTGRDVDARRRPPVAAWLADLLLGD